MMDIIPANAIEDYRTDESFSWEEEQTVILPDGTKELNKKIYQANLRSSMWYFVPLHPFTIHLCSDGIPENPYESKSWVPQVYDIANITWRKATRWECEHWDDLVNCTNCNHPTIPQFECNVCGEHLSLPLKEINKRVLSLVCILPDTTDYVTSEQVERTVEESEKEESETSELEDVVEEKVSEQVIEREEDEETKVTSDN